MNDHLVGRKGWADDSDNLHQMRVLEANHCDKHVKINICHPPTEETFNILAGIVTSSTLLLRLHKYESNHETNIEFSKHN
jgi:hypothetical protein